MTGICFLKLADMWGLYFDQEDVFVMLDFVDVLVLGTGCTSFAG